MKKFVIILTGALMLLAGSCTKETAFIQKLKSTDLVIPADFNWKTVVDLKVNVTGLPLSKDFFSTMTITSAEGKTFFAGNYNLKENLILDLIVPATISELTLTCGKRIIKSAVVDGVIDFSFIQKDDQSDLGK
jgi:hypothetical protein